MPAPLIPLALKAAQIGTIAALAWHAGRRAQRLEGPRGLWRERALDDVEEGLETDIERSADTARAGLASRYRRAIRLGASGPGVEVDLSMLARLTLRRL